MRFSSCKLFRPAAVNEYISPWPAAGLLPLGFQKSLTLQAVQRRVKRSLLHLQGFFGGDKNPLCDAIAMQRLLSDGLEDQQVESALDEVGLLGWHSA